MQKITLFLLCIFSMLWSCTESPYYTMDDFSTVRKADTHVHIRNKQGAFVEQAKADNFQVVNILVDGGGTWAGIYEQFEYAKYQQNTHPKTVKMISAFSVEDFHEPGWSDKAAAWVQQTFDEGAIGLKVWKNIGMVLKDTNDVNVMLDDDRFDEVFAFLERSDKVLIGHLGEPFNCWLPLDEMTTNNDRAYFGRNPQYHMYQHPDLPSYADQMNARNRRLDKNPELNFVGAHVASIEWNVDTLATWLERYPEAKVDLAARMGQIFYQTQQDREKVRDFFIKYPNRVMYATDFVMNADADPESFTQDMHDTWTRDWQYFVSDEVMESDLVNGSFQGIQLPKEVVDQIFYQNAAEVFGFKETME